MTDKQTVVVAVFDHEYGTDVRVFRTEAQAFQWRTDIAEDWWDHEFPDEERPPESEIGERYFDLMSAQAYKAEYFQVFERDVEGLMPQLLEALDLVQSVAYGNTEFDVLERRANDVLATIKGELR